MPWSVPKTWATGELVTASLLNTHLRDQLDYLKDPPYTVVNLNEATNYTTTSTSFVEIDTVLSATITTSGGEVLITAELTVIGNTADMRISFTVECDGSNIQGDDGIAQYQQHATTNRASIVTICHWHSPSEGAHTYKLKWKVSAGTATVAVGTGVAPDVHGQFAVREVS